MVSFSVIRPKDWNAFRVRTHYNNKLSVETFLTKPFVSEIIKCISDNEFTLELNDFKLNPENCEISQFQIEYKNFKYQYSFPELTDCGIKDIDKLIVDGESNDIITDPLNLGKKIFELVEHTKKLM